MRRAAHTYISRVVFFFFFFPPFFLLIRPHHQATQHPQTQTHTSGHLQKLFVCKIIQTCLLPPHAASDIWPRPKSSQNPPQLRSSEIIQIRLMSRSDGYRRSSCLHTSILMHSAYCCRHGQGCWEGEFILGFFTEKTLLELLYIQIRELCFHFEHLKTGGETKLSILIRL